MASALSIHWAPALCNQESRHCSLGPLGLVAESGSQLKAVSATWEGSASCHGSPEKSVAVLGRHVRVGVGAGQEAVGRAAQYG